MNLKERIQKRTGRKLTETEIELLTFVEEELTEQTPKEVQIHYLLKYGNLLADFTSKDGTIDFSKEILRVTEAIGKALGLNDNN